MLEDASHRAERQSCEEGFGSRIVRMWRECGAAESVLSRDGESAERSLPRHRHSADAPRAERRSSDRESAGSETAERDEARRESAGCERCDRETAEREQISDGDVSDRDPASRRAPSARTSRNADVDERNTEQAERRRVTHYITISPCGPPPPRGWSRSLHGRIVSTFWNPRGSFNPRCARFAT